MDTGLNKNQVELAILVIAMLLKMLPDGHSLLDEVVEILRQSGGEAVDLQDAQDLGACHCLDLTDSVRVTQHHSDLSWAQTLLREFADGIAQFAWGGLEPRWGSTLVWNSTAANTLSGIVHATHG